MMNRIATLGVIALIGGCAGDEGVKTGETGTTTDSPVDCPDGFYNGPVVVTRASATCLNANTVRFEVETDGWTTDGTFFAQETGNTDSPYAQWSDEHDIESYLFDECGAWDTLERELATGAGLQWVVNESTLFQCTPDVHYDGSGVMTYAARVYDLDSNFASCLAWGHDVPGMLNGTYNRQAEPSNAGELAACETGVPTM